MRYGNGALIWGYGCLTKRMRFIARSQFLMDLRIDIYWRDSQMTFYEIKTERNVDFRNKPKYGHKDMNMCNLA